MVSASTASVILGRVSGEVKIGHFWSKSMNFGSLFLEYLPIECVLMSVFRPYFGQVVGIKGFLASEVLGRLKTATISVRSAILQLGVLSELGLFTSSLRFTGRWLDIGGRFGAKSRF